MADTNADKKLQEFLEWEAKNRADGKTIEALHAKQDSFNEKQDAVMTAVRRVVRDRLRDKEVQHRHGRAIKTLQHQVGLLSDAAPAVPDWRAPKEETTGVHSLKEIAEAHEELEARLDADEEKKVEEETWWRRQRWIWFGLAVAGFLAATATGCVTYFSYRIQALEKSVNDRH